MNAPPFPINPSTGERHGSWVWNGARWICAPTTGIQVLCTVFTTSGPYMPSPGLVSCVAELLGGGGAGGGLVSGFSANESGVGGGGGSGGYSRGVFPAALVLGGVNVTIGAGGVANSGAAGGDGQATTFGALCTANGGGGGGPSSVAAWGSGGDGGVAGAGSAAFPGNNGLDGYFMTISGVGMVAGSGAGSAFGGSVRPPAISGQSFNGTDAVANSGAGGSGAWTSLVATSAAFAGGSGGAGICIVTEYAWASASDGDDCMNPPLNVNARVAVTHVPWQGPGPCPPGWGGYIESDD